MEKHGLEVFKNWLGPFRECEDSLVNDSKSLRIKNGFSLFPTQSM